MLFAHDQVRALIIWVNRHETVPVNVLTFVLQNGVENPKLSKLKEIKYRKLLREWKCIIDGPELTMILMLNQFCRAVVIFRMLSF